MASPLSPLSPSSAVVTDPAGPSSLIDAGWVETRPYRAAQRPSRPLGTCGRTTTRPIEPAALGTIDGTTPDSGHGEDQDFPKGIASTSRACAQIARRVSKRRDGTLSKREDPYVLGGFCDCRFLANAA